MAWRINEAVVRGEIDNRTRGRVSGRLWLSGRAEPVELRLRGDCWRDLAGRRLEFTNPHPVPGDHRDFAAVQVGFGGDITASRKVKVPDIPLDQIGEYYAAKKPFPWHWGNSLYLEWYGSANGRVVIETAEFELKIVGEAAWEMTEAEEKAQRRANSEGLTKFVAELGEGSNGGPVSADTEWNEKPQTETEAERMQARSEQLVDRIQARMAREGAAADFAKILREEMERLREERGESVPTAEQLARNAEWIEEMNRAGEEAINDPELQKEMDQKHPLAERAYELSLQLSRESAAGGWVPADASEEHPVAELVGGVMKAGAKLAGALNGQDWPPGVESCAGILVRLKRARNYLDDAQRALESCQEQKLLEPTRTRAIGAEVAALAQETDEIIAELRAQLERGTD